MQDGSSSLQIPVAWTLTLAQDAGPPLENVPGIPGAPVDGTNAPGLGTQQGRQPGLFDNPFILILPLLMVFILMSLFAGRKEKKRRAEMLGSLKKHDRVQTMGGIIGTIVELKDDEMVLRVDEQSNTRIRFARSAAQAVLRESNVREAVAEA